MAQKQQMQADLVDAMKSGDTVARDTIRFTLAALRYAEIDKGGELNETEEVALLHREAKRRGDSIDQFRSAGRTDLVEKEEAQLEVLRRYLPADLTDDDLSALVRQVIAETGAESPRDIGKVMPVLIARSAGRADGKRLSAAARMALESAG